MANVENATNPPSATRDLSVSALSIIFTTSLLMILNATRSTQTLFEVFKFEFIQAAGYIVAIVFGVALMFTLAERTKLKGRSFVDVEHVDWVIVVMFATSIVQTMCLAFAIVWLIEHHVLDTGALAFTISLVSAVIAVVWWLVLSDKSQLKTRQLVLLGGLFLLGWFAGNRVFASYVY